MQNNIIKQDFDRIAEAEGDTRVWNHNNCYYPLLFRNMPRNCRDVLEIGCGKGELCALIAEAGANVVGVDFSANMIDAAKAVYGGNGRIRLINADITSLYFDSGSLDAIVTVATAHHLDFEWLLRFARDKLRPGGRLLILDLCDASTIADHIHWACAVIPNKIINAIHNRNYLQNKAASDAWQIHGDHDDYMTLPQIAALARKHAPGVKVRRLLYWRYFLLWQK